MNEVGYHESCSIDSTGCRNSIIKELHIAPMLNVSTVEFHAFMRILTKRCILWTEMIVDETIYFQRYLMEKKDSKSGSDHEDENDDNNVACTSKSSGDWMVPPHILYPVKTEDHPIACQIGTIHPIWTAIATQCIVKANYNVNELNINLDCPSSRVQGKEFGAVLMQDVSKVITFIQAIQQQLPPHMCVSVKCRIGMIIDDISGASRDSDDTAAATITTETDYDWIVRFIKEISSVCERFILHARPVILHGIQRRNNKNNSCSSNISPAQNRCIPPLNYVWVYRLCNEFPDCNFIINGGISDLITAKRLCYGVMDDNALPISSSSDDIYQGHGVPCKKCQQQHPTVKYGSCIVPHLYPAPSKLRGCMIGRAAIDHPIQFAKVDQFWYNDCGTIDAANNKAMARRQVLQQYCQFLDKLYPRRCCDNNDTIITSELPAPITDSIRPFCYICKEFRQSPFVRSWGDDNVVDTTPTVHSDSAKQSDQHANTIKIATRIIDRSFKPILNIFHGCNGSKMFRHHCEVLRRNTEIRNCGPAYILYHATIQMRSISDAILDESII